MVCINYYLLVFAGALVSITLFALLGYIVVSYYVGPRNNGGLYLGGLFGLLVALSVHMFFLAWPCGLLAIMFSLGYLKCAFHFQRGF